MKAKFLDKLSQNNELVIVGLVLLVLLMMIIPLSSVVMDAIIAFNLGVSLIVLMVVIYMKTPLALTSFPGILLILTMLRIGITVSTSRLILLDGEAGEIINTFGEFVVGGNLVVGIIIFTIVTIINFIVITKGSERVAEVSARFSLDAMPGKQMAIDADVRAGSMSNEDAQTNRRLLGLESKLFGAMDGAMKFVKGDAIANIIDIIVNLSGGLIIGILQRGMDFEQALHTYSTLTIGDGLVQQIPALVVSLTAGLMITRVSDQDESTSLGKNILTQVFSDYKALYAASFFILLLSIVPGMPSIVFLCLFIGLVGLGVFIYKQRQKNSDGGSGSAKDKKDNSEVDTPTTELKDKLQLQHVLPLILYVASSIKNTPQLKTLKQIINDVRQDIMLDLGIMLPQVSIKFEDKYEESQFQIMVHEIPVSSGMLYWKHILVIENNEQYATILDSAQSVENKLHFGGHNLGYWFKLDNKALCDKFKFSYLTAEEFFILHFKYTVKAYLADFLGIQETKVLLDQMVDYQELIRELLRLLPINKITEILQRLITEEVSIRNFKLILDTIMDWGQREKEPIIIVEYVRQAMGRYIAYKFGYGKSVIQCMMLSYEIENIIRDSIRHSSAGNYLDIDPRISYNIISQIKNMLSEISSMSNNVDHVVIITKFDIRRYVRLLIEKDIRSLPVLSVEELGNHIEFDCCGVIELDNELVNEYD